MNVDSGEAAVMPEAVAAVFSNYDVGVRAELLALRDLIFETAAETVGVGAIRETLKWGQPSYLTSETRSGSTIRIAPTGPGSDDDYALFFICHTNLVESFKDMFGDALNYEGDRALVFSVGTKRPTRELRECIAMALTYHLSKR